MDEELLWRQCHTTSSGQRRFSIFASVHSNTTSTFLSDSFNAIRMDSSGLLRSIAVGTGTGETAGGPVCALHLTQMPVMTIPGQPSRIRSFCQDCIGPSITIGGDADGATPTNLIIGGNYTLYLQSFPARQPIVIKLIRGLAIDGPIVATVQANQSKRISNDVVVAPWHLPTEQYKTGDRDGARYYLYAYPKSLPALFTCSPQFTIGS